MKIEVGENSEIIVREIYNGIKLVSDSGEELNVSMRDSGFEIIYNNIKYELKNNNLEKIGCNNFCGMNYCDDNGCLERKRNNVEVSENSICVAN